MPLRCDTIEDFESAPAGPLCVCDLQAILQEPQVKMSKHLGYLKQHGLIECKRQGNWNVYRLTKNLIHFWRRI